MQLSFFDGSKPFVIDKPVRLIELFSGIGAQAKAFKRSGIPFEHWRICEFDKYAVCSYNAIHGTNFKTSDITKITADDLAITDTDTYCYVLTYSFPCQDLSNAGKRKGMGKGTRSGLLWEVERLLSETAKLYELPQMLIMENVPGVIGKKNTPHFLKWLEFLESLGYKNYYKQINAKNCGVPQNRERVFMYSFLGDFYFEFAEDMPLEKCLKDVLKPVVDKKYYLTEKQINAILNSSFNKQRNSITSGGHNELKILTAKRTEYGKSVRKQYESGTIKESRHKMTALVPREDYISNTLTTVQKDNLLLDASGIYTDASNSFQRGPLKGLSRAITSKKPNNGTTNGLTVRKLVPLECWRLMDFDDEDFYKAQKALNDTFYKGKDKSSSQLYKQAGNSIVVSCITRNLEGLKL